MNTPNPLVPQGTFLDHRPKSNFRLVVFTILTVHVVLLGALLLAGCRKPAEPTAEPTNIFRPFEPMTNVFIPPTPPPTNLAPSVPSPTDVLHIPPIPSPPSTVVAAPEPAVADREHVVARGDTFYDLAKKYNVNINALIAANPGVNPRQLQLGDKIRIPLAAAGGTGTPANGGPAPGPAGEKVYKVKSGDTLYAIAKAHGTTVKAIMGANNLRTTQIKVGQDLKIPAKTVEAATPPQP